MDRLLALDIFKFVRSFLYCNKFGLEVVSRMTIELKEDNKDYIE